ncbi:hypothetical protein [Limnobacter sp.]|uniref:hypothetical protein n=1 Tax=Limnobacter sp. TaxID=2003368 RepID=UPI00258586AB|nr:hypothetical protein [Limnobacter sp.]
MTGLVWVAPTAAQAHSRHHRHVDEPSDGQYRAIALAQAALPNAGMTPGAVNSAVTQNTLDSTICRPSGYTKSIRPPGQYTSNLKRRQIVLYGYEDRRMADYEEDHLISLELGGAPSDPRNLWPQPHHVIGGWGSFVKDQLENRLHTMVCRRQITLAQAQQGIAHNWIDMYKRYISEVPTRKPSKGE